MKKYLIAMGLSLHAIFGVGQSLIPNGISKDSIYPLHIFPVYTSSYTVINKTLSFYYYKPASYDPLTSPVLFSLHGQGGDGLGPIGDLMTIANRRNALIIAPNFGISPNISLLNATYTALDSLYLNCYGDLGPATVVINEIYKHVLQRENRTNVPAYMIGFSQGGQFVTRYALYRQAYPDNVPFKMFVSTNPYYYTFPTDTFNGVPMHANSGLLFSQYTTDLINANYCPELLYFYTYDCPEHIKQYYNENYGVLIGTADTSPLSDNASAMAQGSNRYQRAQTFYNFGLSDAPNYGTTLNWKYREVIGVGHDQNQMFNNKNLPTDTFTIAERLLFDTPYNPTAQIAPVASFTSDIITATLPSATISFSSTSTGATSYFWDFGDGNTSTLANPVHTYTSMGVDTYTVYTSVGSYTVDGYFVVKLSATNSTGCDNWSVKKHYIHVLPANTSGLNELGLNDKKLLIMPNPTNNEAIIQLQDLKENNLILEIYNYSGQLVLKTYDINSESIKLDTRDYNSGIYFLKVLSKSKIHIGKLIVQH